MLKMPNWIPGKGSFKKNLVSHQRKSKSIKKSRSKKKNYCLFSLRFAMKRVNLASGETNVLMNVTVSRAIVTTKTANVIHHLVSKML